MLFRELSECYEKLESISSRLSMIEVLGALFKKLEPDEVKSAIYITQGVLAPPFEGVEFGMAEKMVEEAIAMSTGHTKEQVESAYRKYGDMGRAAFEMKGASRQSGISARHHTINEVYAAMLKIASTSGHGSKDLKIKGLASMLSTATPLEAKYLAKYPFDELRLGVGDSTVLEALSVMAADHRKLKAKLERAYNLCSDLGLVGETLAQKGEHAIDKFKITLFKPIRPALAERLPTAEEIIEKMHGKCEVDQKYDGFRCQVHKSGKKVKIFSRRLEDTTHMFPDIVEAVIKEISADTIVFEGEAIAYNDDTQEFLPFQETIQRKRKHGVAEKAAELPLHVFAFDLMYINGEDYMEEPYKKRRETLEKAISEHGMILPAGSITATSAKQLEKFFQDSIASGLEGIIAKDPNAPYIAGARKFSWIKMKRSYKGELEDTVDLVIVGYYLGRGMRAAFKFGGLLCAAYNKKRDMFETISRIGSGFTEEQMKELKQMLDKTKVNSKPARLDSVVEPDFWVYPKYVVTVKADEITRSPMHTCGKEKLPDGTEAGYALRFPRLVGAETIRKDKSVEEATTTKEIIEMYGQQKKVKLEDSGA
jgi:DNA ligase-1